MTCTPQELAAAAACYQCLPDGVIRGIKSQLLCDWVNQPSQPTCSEVVVDQWLADMDAGMPPGYTRPSAATIEAVCQFVRTLRINGILDRFVLINPIIPNESADSLAEMLYILRPILPAPAQPWLNSGGFVAADLNVNGLRGDGISKYIDTGLVGPDSYFELSEGGLSIYETEVGNGGQEYELAVMDNDAAEYFTLSGWDTLFGAPGPVAEFWDVGCRVAPLIADTPAFYSASRSTDSQLDLYQGTGGIISNHWQNLTQNFGVCSQTPFFMACNVWFAGLGAPAYFSGKRVAFAAIHYALSQAETLLLYQAVRTMRAAFGAGIIP